MVDGDTHRATRSKLERPRPSPLGQPGTQGADGIHFGWRLDALVIHRVGALKPADQIVLVAVTSAHRGEAFAACEFIIDYLKTRAPFWKKESTPEGVRWVDARTSDDDAAARWSVAPRTKA